MDAFENVVAMLLERDGYWVRPEYKVDLTKEEKRAIGRPSCPRWELDIVAYKGASNELLVVECKSYLDSKGVSISGFDGSDDNAAKRYKLFNDDVLRRIVFNRLVLQLKEAGSCPPAPNLTLCLAAGRVASETDRVKLREHFGERGWLFWDDDWLHSALVNVSKCGYENEVLAIVAKLLLRRSGPA